MDIPIILPGSTIGILGGGQLGKMLAMLAYKMGYRVVVWAPKGDNPAMEIATHKIAADFDDSLAFRKMCFLADVVTTEWENIPVCLLESFEKEGKLVAPSSRILTVAQSRFKEKSFARDCKVPITPTLFIKKSASIGSLCIDDFMPGVLKTNRMGYDGKGQSIVTTLSELEKVFIGYGCDCVLERLVDIDYEISVLVARNKTGMQVSPAVVNKHKYGILDTSSWRVGLVPKEIEGQAQDYTMKIAEMVELWGILVVEFFVSKKGKLIFNEMAPRQHNSFHASVEAANTSQFDQHIRAICGLPIDKMVFHHGFVMKNILGGSPKEWSSLMEDTCNLMTLYGKKNSKPQRKMGHYVRLQKL